MSLPNIRNKYKYKAFSSAEKYVKHKIETCKYPEKIDVKSIIICYSPELMNHVKDCFEIRHIKKFYGDLYLIENNKHQIGILGNFGIGAPAITTLMEELIVYGVKNFISIGEAGGLQDYLKINDIVICEKSIRDEGVSYHYIKSSKYSKADDALTKKIKKILKKENIDFYTGKGWTIDTPYRETKKEIKRYQKEGILTVDMEASAMFAVAQAFDVKAAAIFVISDNLTGKKWKQQYHSTPEKIIAIFRALYY